MNPKIVEKRMLLLTGFSFFGNPFENKDMWSEENEIGKLWHRWMSFIQQNPSKFPGNITQDEGYYEVHISHTDTIVTGEFEVFIGMAVTIPAPLPVELVLKTLPATQYAVFTLTGDEIESDWPHMIYEEWMPQTGYREAYPFNFQYYDQRFKGISRLSESIIDVYVPIKQ